jgi:class 3 adenylate cyclase/tetratricopeptide (TPR) repeat protein
VSAAPTTPAARRLVTVAVAGLVGDTALTERLDPESMHRVVDRHWQICTDVFRRHGGTVQAAAGDVVVGVVGLTELHEDDALRAVRAALELRDAVTAFGRELERDFGVRVTGRCGIDSGEVFVGAGTRREAFATGDAVDRAIRLEQAAADGDILLGEGTYRLVEPAVRAEAREPVDLGRRVVPVPTWRLRGTRADDAAPVHPATPFVGRHRELTALRAELARAVRESACRLVTVVGPAGIGKSRLASELAADLGERATVAVGHCLAYGEGITYRPLAEIVGQVTGGHPPARIADVLRGADPSGVIARRVLGAVGLSCEPTHAEEMFWAVRRLFEWAAQQRPLVAVVEDIHRAEPTLLDLLDHLVAFSSGAAILLVCLARPELTESRPTWVVPEHNRSVLVLEPLDEPDAYRLVEALGADGLDRATMTRAVETAEGNPLFLEQLVAVRPTAGGQRLPPTIQALLAARIDRLEPGERRVLAYGSVEGRSFHRAAVTDLLPEAERGDSGTRLMSLVRKQLIRPDRPQFATGDAFRFAHTLIRDAAYEGLPKELRSRLHERMAGWLRTGPGAPDELIGYHLERAYRLRGDLGRIGERERALAAEAAGRLDAAARAALLRGDLPAGAGLLERAVQVLAPDDPARSALLPRLGAALFDAGRLADADRVLEEAVRRAGEQDSPPLAALARVERQRVRLQVEPRQALTTTDDVARHALEVLARHGDELGQCRAWCLRASVRWTRGRSVDADGAWQRAADHARRAGDDRELFEILGWRASAAAFGPLPVPEAIRRCTRIREQVRDSPVAVAVALHPLGLLHALRGDLDRARRVIREGNTILDELGRTQSTVSHHECLVELLAGRPAVAERRLRAGYEKLRATGEGTLLAATAAMLARALHAQGRDEEAEWECGVSQRYAATGDQPTQVMWRGVRARILARRGRLAEAEALAREAVRLAEPTDLIVIRGDALLDLADVLDAAARPRAADAAVRQGLALYERKGAVLPAGRARSRLVMPGRMPTG